MKKTEVKLLKEPKLKKPLLIEGLPGLGLVGKIAADHLISELKAVKFAEIYSPFFPPQVLIESDGTVRMMKNEFYYWKAKNKSQRDIIFVVGDHQGSTPESHYEVCSAILDLYEAFGGKMVYTLGGLATGRLAKKPKVFGAATDKKLVAFLKKAGTTFERTGIAVVGAAGLLLGLAGKRKMQAACLMGETHGQIIDSRGAKAVLEVLQNLLHVKINLSKLEKRAKETEKMIEKAEATRKQQQTFSELPTGGPTYIR